MKHLTILLWNINVVYSQFHKYTYLEVTPRIVIFIGGWSGVTLTDFLVILGTNVLYRLCPDDLIASSNRFIKTGKGPNFWSVLRDLFSFFCFLSQCWRCLSRFFICMWCWQKVHCTKMFPFSPGIMNLYNIQAQFCLRKKTLFYLFLLFLLLFCKSWIFNRSGFGFKKQFEKN